MTYTNPHLTRQIAALYQHLYAGSEGLTANFLSSLQKTTIAGQDILHYIHFLWNRDDPEGLPQTTYTWDGTVWFEAGTDHLMEQAVGDLVTLHVLRESLPEDFATHVAGTVQELFDTDRDDRILDWLYIAGLAPADIATPQIRTTVEAGIAERTRRIREKAQAQNVRFHPPISEEELVTLERQYGITLPGGYRYCITHIGNGWIDARYDMNLRPFPNAPEPESLALPFELTDSISVNTNLPEGAGGDEDKFEELFELYGVERETIITARDRGTLWLWDDYLLVVNGRERGNVWWSHEDIFPDASGGITITRIDAFLFWCEDWMGRR